MNTQQSYKAPPPGQQAPIRASSPPGGYDQTRQEGISQVVRGNDSGSMHSREAHHSFGNDSRCSDVYADRLMTMLVWNPSPVGRQCHRTGSVTPQTNSSQSSVEMMTPSAARNQSTQSSPTDQHPPLSSVDSGQRFQQPPTAFGLGSHVHHVPGIHDGRGFESNGHFHVAQTAPGHYCDEIQNHGAAPGIPGSNGYGGPSDHRLHLGAGTTPNGYNQVHSEMLGGYGGPNSERQYLQIGCLTPLVGAGSSGGHGPNSEHVQFRASGAPNGLIQIPQPVRQSGIQRGSEGSRIQDSVPAAPSHPHLNQYQTTSNQCNHHRAQLPRQPGLQQSFESKAAPLHPGHLNIPAQQAHRYEPTDVQQPPAQVPLAIQNRFVQPFSTTQYPAPSFVNQDHEFQQPASDFFNQPGGRGQHLSEINRGRSGFQSNENLHSTATAPGSFGGEFVQRDAAHGVLRDVSGDYGRPNNQYRHHGAAVAVAKPGSVTGSNGENQHYGTSAAPAEFPHILQSGPGGFVRPNVFIENGVAHPRNQSTQFLPNGSSGSGGLNVGYEQLRGSVTISGSNQAFPTRMNDYGDRNYELRNAPNEYPHVAQTGLDEFCHADGRPGRFGAQVPPHGISQAYRQSENHLGVDGSHNTLPRAGYSANLNQNEPTFNQVGPHCAPYFYQTGSNAAPMNSGHSSIPVENAHVKQNTAPGVPIVNTQDFHEIQKVFSKYVRINDKKALTQIEPDAQQRLPNINLFMGCNLKQGTTFRQEIVEIYDELAEASLSVPNTVEPKKMSPHGTNNLKTPNKAEPSSLANQFFENEQLQSLDYEYPPEQCGFPDYSNYVNTIDPWTQLEPVKAEVDSSAHKLLPTVGQASNNEPAPPPVAATRKRKAPTEKVSNTSADYPRDAAQTPGCSRGSKDQIEQREEKKAINRGYTATYQENIKTRRTDGLNRKMWLAVESLKRGKSIRKIEKIVEFLNCLLLELNCHPGKLCEEHVSYGNRKTSLCDKFRNRVESDSGHVALETFAKNFDVFVAATKAYADAPKGEKGTPGSQKCRAKQESQDSWNKFMIGICELIHKRNVTLEELARVYFRRVVNYVIPQLAPRLGEAKKFLALNGQLHELEEFMEFIKEDHRLFMEQENKAKRPKQ